VDVDAPDAEVYLFRYESYETVRTSPAVIPRLVPVPTPGIGRVRPGEWVPGFYPGDPCLVVTKAPEKGSPADGLLEPGDLVIRLNDLECGDGLFVTEVTPDGPAAKAGVQPFDRIDSIDGSRVEVRHDWTQVERAKESGGTPYQVRLRRVDRSIDVEGRTTVTHRRPRAGDGRRVALAAEDTRARGVAFA
jgi:C-terminal processing protease CtpA/Prc